MNDKNISVIVYFVDQQIKKEAADKAENQDGHNTLEISKNLSGPETLNYLKFSFPNLNISECVLVIKTGIQTYKVLDQTHDLGYYARDFKNVALYVCPKSYKLTIIAPDGNRYNINPMAETSFEEIVRKICILDLYLKLPFSYELYSDPNNINNPIPKQLTIIEYDPMMKEVYILRRFWVSIVLKFRGEHDVNFNFAQARSAIFNPTLNPRNRDLCLLAAINLVVLFQSDQDQAKKALKKATKADLAAFYPGPIANDAKLQKKVFELYIDNCSLSPNDAKMLFIETMLKEPLLTSPLFDIQIDNGNKYIPAIFELTEKQISILHPRTFESLRDIKLTRLYKIKPIDTDTISINYYIDTDPKIAKGGKKPTEYKFKTALVKELLECVGALTSFMDNLRKEREKKATDESSKTERVSLSTRSLASMSSMLTDSQNLQSSKIGVSNFKFDEIQGPQSRCEPPSAQQLIETDLNNISLKREETQPTEAKSDEVVVSDDYPLLYVSSSDYYPYSELTSIVQSVIDSDSVSLAGDLSNMMKQSELDCWFANEVNDLYLSPSSNDDSKVAGVIRCASLIAHALLLPLDAFKIAYMCHNIVHGFASKRWAEFDFSKIECDKTFSEVPQPMSLSTASLVFEGISEASEEAKAISSLCDSDLLSLILCGTEIAKALTSAKISVREVQPLLNELPELPVPDPIYAFHLGMTLLPIVKKVADSQSLSQRMNNLQHKDPVNFSAMISVLEELSQFSRGMASPASMHMLALSPRASAKLSEAPSSLSEAADLFRKAKEVSYLLWNMNDSENADLAISLSETSSSYFNQFYASTKDPILATKLSSSFEVLKKRLEESIDVFSENKTLEAMINPNNPTMNVFLKMIKAGSESSQVSKLMAIDTYSNEEKSALFLKIYSDIDAYLRSNETEVSNEKKNQILYNFSVMSFSALSLGKNDPLINEAKISFSKIGARLNKLLKSDADKEVKLKKMSSIRAHLRPLLALLHDSNNAFDGFVNQKKKVSPRSYMLYFQLPKPKIEKPIEMLKQISDVLKTMETEK